MDLSRQSAPAIPDRFAGVSRRVALCIVAAMLVLIGVGLAIAGGPAAHAPPARHAQGESDMALYRAIVARMRTGDSYGHAAVVEQRARNYPVRPIIAIRPPTLATLVSWFPSEAWAGAALQLMAAVTIVIWMLRLEKSLASFPALVVSMFLLATGFSASLIGEGACMFHENWAGVLVCLSLGLRTDRRFVASAIAAGLAAAFRELALPFILVMAVVDWAEGRRREALAFVAAGVVAVAYLICTWAQVSPLLLSRDPVSPGWVRLSGWGFVLDTTQWNALVALGGLGGSVWLRTAFAAVVAPLCLLGALNWRGSGLRLPAVLIGYAAGFMVIGRPDNSYWGLLTTPLMALGLSLAPPAMVALGHGISNRLGR